MDHAQVDALAIVEGVKRLRSDQQLVAKLSTGALAFAREHFDWKKNTSKLEHFYQKVALKKQDRTHDLRAATP